MPSKSKSSGSKKRAQGGGRNPNSEPRLQVFKGFTGVNFQNSPLVGIGDDVDTPISDGDQTDLQMTYLFLQNNVDVVPGGTLETRNKIIDLLYAKPGVEFTGPVLLHEETVYVAQNDEMIGWIHLPLDDPDAQTVTNAVPLGNYTGSHHTWTSFDWYDNMLIGATLEGELWSSDRDHSWLPEEVMLSNSARINEPWDPPELVPHGEDLMFDTGWTEENTFRVVVGYTYVNKFGPTMLSPTTIIYTNIPVSEWNSENYFSIVGTVPTGYGYEIDAVEFYFATDNAEEMIFLGRVDTTSREGRFEFSWHGYNNATSMWPVSNLIMPTENYTQGPPVRYVTHVDGRLYFWHASGHQNRLYIGGNPGNLLSVSPGTGGGYVDIDPGTGMMITNVMKYKTQSGNSIVTMLTRSINSKQEQRYNLVENSVALSNEQNLKSWQSEQVAGAVGCQSEHGSIVCADGLYAISRYGLALTTMTMEYNSQIQTTYVSDPIKPVFTNLDFNYRLRNSVLLELNGIIYMAFGQDQEPDRRLDNVLFCYDIAAKAWWTYTLDIEDPILNLFHVDCSYMGREGIGIVTQKTIYMLPTTNDDPSSQVPDFPFLIQTAKLSTLMPMQGWQYLSQLEFHFDNFIGTMHINVRMEDMFGRTLNIDKTVTESELVYDYVVWMRIDQRIMSYVITMNGMARFRLTHFIARVYTMSNKMTQIWGFDDSITHRSSGDVHPTFKSYNDVRDAIFP